MLNWQRIMPPFALKNDGNHVDDEWMRNEFVTQDHAVIKQSAPCRLSRNMPLADLSLKIGQYQPWVLCATHPNGAVGVYSTRRTVPDWENCWAYADITISVKTVDSPVGIFGESYDTLTLVYPQDVTQKHVWVQDLADDTAYDVTNQVQRTKIASHSHGISSPLLAFVSKRKTMLACPDSCSDCWMTDCVFLTVTDQISKPLV